MTQGQVRQRRDKDAPAPTPPKAAAVKTKPGLDDDVDAILDEIDEVLETNAKEFVTGFVQKGGE